MLPAESYPILIPNMPTIWRRDPYRGVLAMGDSASTDPVTGEITVVNPVDLTRYGPDWACQIRADMDGIVAAEFAIDDTHAADGYLIISLTGDQTEALVRTRVRPALGIEYGMDVQASGGAVSPFTVWRAPITVDGDWTHDD